MTVGYGLWTFQLVDRPGDEVTAAMVGYLLKNQNEDGHWGPPSNRPPLEESKVMCTVLAMYGMQEYADEPQRAEVDAAISKGRLWLDAASIESQEDRVARLWGLHLFDGSAESRRAAQQAILDEQRDDGSWSQLDDMSGDAYATGLTLATLRETGFDPRDPAFIKGCEFLLRNQLPDGSWLVETRSKPVQVYFDNGDPHGKHQFISTAASSWAVAVLVAAGENWPQRKHTSQKQAEPKQAEAASCPD
jgi:N-acyl-D-amino-acid deacylase